MHGLLRGNKVYRGWLSSEDYYMGSINVSSISTEKTYPKDRVSMFFENHATMRRIAIYAPCAIGMAYFAERATSSSFMPSLNISYAIALFSLGVVSAIAATCERSLKNKKIERLN